MAVIPWDSSEYSGDGYYWAAQALGVDITDAGNMEVIDTKGYGPVTLFATFAGITVTGSPDIRLRDSSDQVIWGTVSQNNIGNGSVMLNMRTDGTSWRHVQRYTNFLWDSGVDTGTANFYLKIQRTHRTG